MSVDVAMEIVKESIEMINNSRRKVIHCFAQLDDGDIWWKPSLESNSIGIIIQHVMGNLTQWAIAGIGGAADTRERPGEFRVVNKTAKDELLRDFCAVLDRVNEVYGSVGASDILRRKTIQTFDTSVLGAMCAAVCHLALHTGQILYITRLKLGAGYKESWKPASKEQGA